ncbi:unnamed protein product [Clonostachys rosea f. rosea IK726]|uniref:Uncharacterized protein n=2 Tax=Clonostachys rosea f. rosea IK726 TaxID=1349383 RepID=A0ACA9U9Q7_BIOOC|nr:unnamed protein product [Clonostachys rosea f. rosea IK726]CAG9955400.1 unnamed protein product [Clonostachys rosea f. rosea IK726]
MMDQMQSKDIHSVADLDSARELELTPSFQSSGTPTQPNSQTRYFEFESATPTEPFPASVRQVDPPPESAQSTKKPRQPAIKPRPSKRLEEKKKKKLEGRRDRGKHSEPEATPGFQEFMEQLRLLEEKPRRLLEEQHRRRSELSS